MAGLDDLALRVALDVVGEFTDVALVLAACRSFPCDGSLARIGIYRGVGVDDGFRGVEASIVAACKLRTGAFAVADNDGDGVVALVERDRLGDSSTRLGPALGYLFLVVENGVGEFGVGQVATSKVLAGCGKLDGPESDPSTKSKCIWSMAAGAPSAAFALGIVRRDMILLLAKSPISVS